MKIIKVSEVRNHVIEMDSGEYPIYERNSADNWLVLMGESWETAYNQEELEKLYQEHITVR